MLLDLSRVLSTQVLLNQAFYMQLFGCICLLAPLNLDTLGHIVLHEGMHAARAVLSVSVLGARCGFVSG